MSARMPSIDLPSASIGGDRLQPMLNASVHKMPSTETMGMMDEEDLIFDSVEEEAAHYREKYRRISDMLEETRAELEDFQTTSKDLEEELERELQTTEKTQRDLRERIQRLEQEKDEWKNKHVNLQRLHSSTTTNMQREMDNLRSERDKTLIALRDLEMGNDELERNERVAVSSLLDLESRYNRAIEEKTLLEQEVIHRQELEEEAQRVKDELRDANNEIAILRDQISRAVPTPPSSISVHMSPVYEAIRENTLPEIPPFVSSPPLSRPASPEYAPTPPPKPQQTPNVKAQLRLPRSATVSSIPTLSPAIKRNSAIPNSPSGNAHLSRSTTSRNLAAASVTPGSPAQALRKSGSNPNQVAKNKGFKMLYDLQARLKAADDKLGPKATKRTVSSSMAGFTRRNVSAAAPPAPPPHSRVAALSENRVENPKTPPTYTGDLSGTTFLSPNGWEIVGHPDDSASFDTPTDRPNGVRRDEPTSPLEPNFRAASSTSTSSRGLPSRPGIPSPLASTNLTRSTTQPPSRPGLPRPTSRHNDLNASRPLSPTMIPVPTRGLTRALSPTTPGTPSSRPGSRSAHRVLGRGPPPSSHIFPNTTHQPLALSVSTSTPNNLRRSTRRSSLSVNERGLPPSGIPAPVSRGGTPTRPTSIATSLAYAPPVPRIPSAHLKESARRNGVLGTSTRERPKSGFEKETGWKT